MTARPVAANKHQSGKMTSPVIAVYALLLTLTLALTSMAAVEMDVRMSQAQIEKLGRQYGEQAKKRLLAWQRLIDEIGTDPEDIKLRKVNKFFNQVRFIDDIKHWGKKDYWATPVEFLISNGGDCEDFTIAKYYTLRQVGVPVEKLSLAYVKALELNQAHMVLTYYEKPSSTPLILDNLISRIKPANRRPDLLHVYSFNADNLWLTKKGRRSTLVGTSDQLKPWVKLKSRIQNLDKDINVQ
ncbi:transglutaminase-like cysteine peptidase [Aliamphritea spongicola]|uniref:transglutaminase-like cysteine peptidase n=1 Tax=Aliamphritea spongicola TaxID=707589 RepID=UPI001FAF96B0|nr:transglutaminase-like cysteine peptidase [Aliamphritea spongicola]